VPLRALSSNIEKKESAEEADFFNRDDADKLRALANKLEKQTKTSNSKKASTDLKKIFDQYHLTLAPKLEQDLLKWKASS